MPDSIGMGLIPCEGLKHTRYPIYVKPALGYTAEIADGANCGARLQMASDHVIRYRLGGPSYMAWFSGDVDDTGTIFLPIYYPPLPDESDRSMLVRIRGMYNTVDLPYYLKWRDGFGSGTYTTVDTGTIGSIGGGVFNYVFEVQYRPPTGTGADAFKVIEIYYEKMYPGFMSAYHLGELISSETNHNVPDGACSAGIVITTDTNSLGGLVELVGTGADNVESMERLTRRTFYCGGHPDGTINEEGDSAYHNQFNVLKWPARCRNLLGNDAKINCYPAFVLRHDGVETGVHDVKIKLTNHSSDTWVYTAQTADDGDVILVTPWSTGSSSSSGIPVASDVDDDITIETYTDANTTIKLYSWALYEGPAY